MLKVSDSLIFDTNIILRYLLRDLEDQYVIVQDKLKSLRLTDGTAVVLGEVVAECIHVMEKLYKMTRVDIVSVLRPFLQTDMVILEDRSVVLRALSMYEAFGLSYVDCLIIQKSWKNNVEIFSFDKKLLAKSK